MRRLGWQRTVLLCLSYRSITLCAPEQLRGTLRSFYLQQKVLSYYIREGVPLENQKIRLVASASSRTQDLFWFLDGELIFQGNAGEQYWLTPARGKHVLTCVDAEGRSATRPLHISLIR